MAQYKSFFHVLRMDDSKMDVYNFLQGMIFVMPKLDGTNSSVWADEDGNIHCGSRKREISVEKDNQDFALFMMTDKSTLKLKEFLVKHPELILYGEWLNGYAGRKQAGTIKQYIDPGFWIFAAFDIEQGIYLDYPTYSSLLDGVYDKVIKPDYILDHPTYQECVDLLKDNHFNLPQDVIGEGYVFNNYDYRDKYGKQVIAKIVAQEYLENKGTRVRVKNPVVRDGLEQDIVDAFITTADFEKCQQKVMARFGVDEWTDDHRMVGAFLSMLFNDLVEEEMWSIIKRFRNPVIDFKILQQCTMQAGRKYLGFI